MTITIKKLTLLISIFVMLATAGCNDNEEPKIDSDDFSKYPDLEKVLIGTWVSVSDDNSIRRYEFYENGRYVSLSQTPDDTSTPVKAGGGTYSVDKNTGVLSLTPTVFGPDHARPINLSSWSDNKLVMKLPTSSDKTEIKEFLRVAGSYIYCPGESFTPDYASLFGVDGAKSFSTTKPDMLDIDPASGSISLKKYGVGYVTVETSNGEQLIEVMGAPLKEWPDFKCLLISYTRLDEYDPSDPSFEQIKQKYDEMMREYEENYEYLSGLPGVENIEVIEESTNTLTFVSRIYVTFSDDFSPLALWNLFTTKYKTITIPLTGDQSSIRLSNSDNSDIYWDEAHKIMIR